MTFVKNIPNIKRILLISFIVYLIAAYFSAGYYHDDEHFQILEFAGFKYGINKPADLAWEYPLRMRSALQPAIAYVVHETFSLFNSANPFHEAMFLRFLSAILALISTSLLIKAFLQKISDEHLKKWFVWLSFLLWFAVYKNVRFSGENWSSHFFIIGLALLLLKTPPFFPSREGIGVCDKSVYFFTGIIWGFAFLCRFQTGFMLVGAFAWLLLLSESQIKQIKGLRRLIPLIIISGGILFIVFVGVLIDRWYYDEWVSSAYNYFFFFFKREILTSTHNEVWWFYLKQGFIKSIPPFNLVYILSIIIVFIFDIKNILTWIFLPFILIHFYLEPKQLRYMFPIINFIPLFIIQAIEILSESQIKQIRGLHRLVRKRWVKNTFWYANIICLIIISFKPAANNIAVYEKIYDSYSKPACLFFIDENPYGKNKFINFYKRSNLKEVKIDKIDCLNHRLSRLKDYTDKTDDTVYLFIAKNSFRETEMNSAAINYKKVYTRFPVWLNHFNYKGWINRKRNWTIYEIKV